MQLSQPLFEGAHLRECSLDDELLLAIRLDAPLPPIDRRHHRKDVHAGSQPLLYQRAGEGDHIGVGAERGQDEDGADISVRARFFLCTRDQNALL